MVKISKNPCSIFEFVRRKDTFFKEINRNLAGEIKCVRGIRDFEESMFDLGVLDCISELAKNDLCQNGSTMTICVFSTVK